MKLNWKSFGDTGRIAEGDQGTWRIVTDGALWHLSVDKLPRGQFALRDGAKSYAQEQEDAPVFRCQYGTAGCTDSVDHATCEM